MRRLPLLRPPLRCDGMPAALIPLARCRRKPAAAPAGEPAPKNDNDILGGADPFTTPPPAAKAEVEGETKPAAKPPRSPQRNRPTTSRTRLPTILPRVRRNRLPERTSQLHE